MAYDRYDPRDERSRWRGDRNPYRGASEDRGFFERAGDEVASWFGDEEAERRRREDARMEGRDGGYGRDENRGRDFNRGRGPDRDRDEERGGFVRSSYRGVSGEGRYGGTWSGPPSEGGYARNEGFFAAGGAPRGDFHEYRGNTWQEREPQIRNEPQRSAFSSGGRSGEFDPHYHSWRQRQLDELDRDYDEYRREHQARFEDEFGSWRQRRQQKRGLLGQIREHMEVVGNDDQHVGTVDRTAGDRIILTKSDAESGGVHHSLSCSDIASVEGDRVILDCSADEARNRWRDENRGRALFEREDQGEMGDRVLDRSFSGTYR
jgi:hypothetical protein